MQALWMPDGSYHMVYDRAGRGAVQIVHRSVARRLQARNSEIESSTMNCNLHAICYMSA